MCVCCCTRWIGSKLCEPVAIDASCQRLLQKIATMLHRGAASSTVQRSCSTGCSQQHNKLVATYNISNKRQCIAAASKQSDRSLSEQEGDVLRKAVLATAVCCAFASNVGAARADSQNWVPRRHHRHIGERFTDTWADSIVEVRIRATTAFITYLVDHQALLQRAVSSCSRCVSLGRRCCSTAAAAGVKVLPPT
jgi:hypothetical protein